MTEISAANILPSPSHGVTLAEAVRVWLRIALLSFGGPAGQIAVMHRILVEEKHRVSESRFLHAINYCMLLPCPEAQQLATYIGWLMHRTRGDIIAGGLFILPGAVANFLFGVPFPLIVLTAGALGFLGAWAGRPEFALGSGHGSAGNDRDEASLLGGDLPAHASPSVGQSLRMWPGFGSSLSWRWSSSSATTTSSAR